VVENARREATLTSELVKKLETAADLLGDAQTDAGEYLEQVSDVLAETHKEFATSMERTLKKSNTAFFNELEGSVNSLNAIVKNIGDTLGNQMPPRR
jgi:DNA anti-recombination protein RmuC